MSSSRLVRGAKTRMFAIVCLICVLGAVVFVFHGTQSKLAEVQKLVNSCNQQQESLSAQLQVIFEYKVRLEKSLAKEKEDHKQTKETLEGKLKDEKLNRDKDNQEAKNKYDALVQQNKLLQNRLDELKENERNQVSKLTDDNIRIQKELDQLRKENDDLKDQKVQDLEDLKTEYQKKKEEISDLEKEIAGLKNQFSPDNEQKSYLERENTQLKEEIERLKKEVDHCEESKKVVEKPRQEAPNTNVGDAPKFVYNGQKVTNGSTTPGLNPDAVNNYEASSPKPMKDMEAPVGKRPNDLVAQPAKKPTQESVVPIALPQHHQAGIDQIPVPVNGHEPQGSGHSLEVHAHLPELESGKFQLGDAKESVVPIALPQHHQAGIDQIPVPVNGHEPQGSGHSLEVHAHLPELESGQFQLGDAKESVVPIAFPQHHQAGIDQIPVPVNGHEPQGNDHNPLVNTIQKPNTGNAGQGEDSGPFVGQGGEAEIDQPKLFAPAPLEEDDPFPKQGEIPRIKKDDNYPHNGGGGDYVQPEDEEDDEGEQLEYDEQRKKEQRNMVQQQPPKNPQAPVREQGVMVNPK